MTATARAKATTFVAVSPTTGRRYTRKSLHAYTHACVTYETVDSMVARAEESAASNDRYVAKYTEIAAHLRAGTTPAAGSPLLARCTSMSYNMQLARVRTEWDAVMFSVRHPNSVYADEGLTAEQFAAKYDEYAAHSAAGAAKARAEAVAIREANTVRESATFHHSYALAMKQAATFERYTGTYVSRIVEATPVTK